MGDLTSAADEAPSTTSDSSSPQYSAFFYGTLMAPEVFFTVCYNKSKPPASLTSEHTFQPAILSDYSRRRVMGRDYPGVIPQEGHTVFGILATGLTEANMLRLDYFEGSEYDKQKVKVKLRGGERDGEEVDALVYVYIYPWNLEDREWDFEEFRKEKMRFWSRADSVFDGCDPDDPATATEGDVVNNADEGKK